MFQVSSRVFAEFSFVIPLVHFSSFSSKAVIFISYNKPFKFTPGFCPCLHLGPPPSKLWHHGDDHFTLSTLRMQASWILFILWSFSSYKTSAFYFIHLRLHVFTYTLFRRFCVKRGGNYKLQLFLISHVCMTTELDLNFILTDSVLKHKQHKSSFI